MISLETIYTIANNGVIPFWLLMAFAPFRWPLVKLIIIVVVCLLAMLYVALFGVFVSSGSGSFASLSGVSQLFSQPGLLLAGWVHYLAFDLLVGLWEREEAARIDISRVWLVICLFFTLMTGPMGWLLFMAVRSFRLRVMTHKNTTEAA
jgi:Domain of unknown function (DUF4281)